MTAQQRSKDPRIFAQQRSKDPRIFARQRSKDPRIFARQRSRDPRIVAPLLLIRGYQLLLSPLVGGACRFDPSCSAYAIEAIETHGAIRGVMLALRRIGRCHPFGGHGHDPVPPRKDPTLPATEFRL